MRDSPGSLHEGIVRRVKPLAGSMERRFRAETHLERLDFERTSISQEPRP